MTVRVKTFKAIGQLYELEEVMDTFLSTLPATNVLDVVIKSAGISGRGVHWFGYVTYREE